MLWREKNKMWCPVLDCAQIITVKQTYEQTNTDKATSIWLVKDKEIRALQGPYQTTYFLSISKVLFLTYLLFGFNLTFPFNSEVQRWLYYYVNQNWTYICPWKTSCDSSITFHILILASRPPDVIARSRVKLSISVIASWWPKLIYTKFY